MPCPTAEKYKQQYKYQRTAAGRATQRRYKASKKGRAAIDRYANSPAKKAASRRNHLRHRRDLSRALRKRLWAAIKHQTKVGSAVRDLGCSIAEFKCYIAKQFVFGMSWDNWGTWHLDHKRSLASVDLTDRAQFLSVCHYTNYQPLWALDNIRKGG
jgi:hypothetical protein